MALVTMSDAEIGKESWFWSWFRWSRTSYAMLRSAEKKILSHLKTAYRGWYVDIGSVVGEGDRVWTVSLNQAQAGGASEGGNGTRQQRVPLVLLHGLGSGSALWVLNFDALAVSRPVYAIDLLGFGRSSRPVFSSDSVEAENQLVQSVEEWRREMQLDSMILLGHSMGGFLAASYAIRYPQRIKHLILADPWGFPEKPDDLQRRTAVPLWVQAIAYLVQPLNPLWAVRFAGPFGQWLIQKTRPDLVSKFSHVVPNDEQIISQYIYQCNVQNPTGESAFHAMMSGFGWAKNPMAPRMESLSKDVPVTLLYGSRSWVDNTAGEEIRKRRAGSYVNVQVISGAGHHVYADKSEAFNKHVVEACEYSDPSVTSKTVANR
ncbi:(Lyso)-N-acylphosphatidylethanolamine lipase isoform X1 [Hetaerina americana]|uniref:(Lyso)-N-acylphosphatidylethanolamine lipase isoform X1 n=1 Tax=Hetaerina americana TaxID=62018 RepID=UPI003A7F400C